MLPISIHAPHTGRDYEVRGGALCINEFQSTRPIRGATGWVSPKMPAKNISIHAPHTGRDFHDKRLAAPDGISIHAPHTGRDVDYPTGR